MLTIIPHLEQNYSWDCGIACVAMVLCGTGIPISISEIESFYPLNSIWTIDLVYLINHYTNSNSIGHLSSSHGHLASSHGHLASTGSQSSQAHIQYNPSMTPISRSSSTFSKSLRDFTFYTMHIGLNWEYASIPFYQSAMVHDIKRVHSLFARAKDQGINIMNVGLSLEDIKRFLSSNRYAIIILVNLNLLTCRLCKEKQRKEKWDKRWRKMFCCCFSLYSCFSNPCCSTGISNNSHDFNHSNGCNHLSPTSEDHSIPSNSNYRDEGGILNHINHNTNHQQQDSQLDKRTPLSNTSSPVSVQPQPQLPSPVKPLATFSNNNSKNTLPASTTHASLTSSVQRRLSFGGIWANSIANSSSNTLGNQVEKGGIDELALTTSLPNLSIQNRSPQQPHHHHHQGTGIRSLSSSLQSSSVTGMTPASPLLPTSITSGGYCSINYKRTRQVSGSGSLLSVFSSSAPFTTIPNSTTMIGKGTFPHHNTTNTGPNHHTCSPLQKIVGKNEKSQRKSKGYKELKEEEFIGHYVVLIGYDQESDMVFYRDPGGSSSLCAIGATDLEKSYRSKGTDCDMIVMKIL